VVTVVLAMLVILGVAAVIAGMVVMGMEGLGKWRAPRLADRMERAAHHLNGDVEHSSR
jgi:uncharacterized protein YjeT (DUF2065 family)